MKTNMYQTMKQFLKGLIQPKQARDFIRHNKVIFGDQDKDRENNRVILLELNSMQSAHIAYSYLANAISENSDVKIVAFEPSLERNWKQNISIKIKKLFKSGPFGVYGSFGAKEFLFPKLKQKQKQKALELTAKLLTEIKTKSDIEGITIEGIWIGDLIYDTYLRKYNKPTIVKEEPDFEKSLLVSIETFIFWNDFFKSYVVQAINVSHCVYNLAIPLRIAATKGIATYQANCTHIYSLNKNNFFAYNDFYYFPERFKTLSPIVQAKGLAEAKRRIDLRFAGNVGVDMSYSSKSAYGEFKEKPLLKKSNRKKVLIATHCFFDSPHSYGKNLFPDFYEWLNCLGHISEVTDYDWYVKTHPDYLPGTMEVIEGFLEKFPKFNLLPADSSHHQIIAEGIDVALTVYGTIGFEYAALGIPVINASLSNPHIAYNFNIHPKSQEDYKKILKNLDGLDFKIDQQEVYEYYFMRHLYNTENIFFDDYAKDIEKLWGYKEQFTPKIYHSWLDQFTPEKHKTIKNALNKFVNSDDFRMDNTHFGTEFLPEHIKE